MIQVTKRFHPPARPWGSLLLLAGLGALAMGVVASILLGAWVTAPRWIFWLHLGTMRLRTPGLDVTALAATLVTLLVTLGALRLGMTAIRVSFARDAAQTLGDHRLLALLAEYRDRLPGCFPGREAPVQVIEVDSPDSRAPRRALDLILSLAAAAALLDVLAVWALQRLSGGDTLVEQTSVLALTGITLTIFLLASLDRARRRILMAGYGMASACLLAMAPHLLRWATGLAPILVMLVIMLTARLIRSREVTWCLFLTNRGVRRLGLGRGDIFSSDPPALKPERLILHPGIEECEWEFWAPGEPGLRLQPLGGKPHDVAVIGTLHGYPLRIQGDVEVRSTTRELASQASSILVLVFFLGLLAAYHWVPVWSLVFERGLISLPV